MGSMFIYYLLIWGFIIYVVGEIEWCSNARSYDPDNGDPLWQYLEDAGQYRY